MENDIRIVKGRGPVQTWAVDDRTTTTFGREMRDGELASVSIASNNYATFSGHSGFGSDVDIMLIGSDRYIGVVAKASSETLTSNGTVDVFLNMPETVIRVKAYPTSTADTASEVKDLINDSVLMYRTQGRTAIGNYYIRPDYAGDPNMYGCLIIDGDHTRYTLDCIVSQLCSPQANLKGQTID